MRANLITNILIIIITVAFVSCGQQGRRDSKGNYYGSAGGSGNTGDGYYSGGYGAGSGDGGDGTGGIGAGIGGGIGDGGQGGYVPIGDGSGVGGGTGYGVPLSALYQSAECLQAAEKGKLILDTTKVRFESTMANGDCQWEGHAGGKLAARKETYRNMSVPAGRKLCYMAIGSEETKFYYDDVFYITLNNRVLMQGGNVLPLQKDQYGFRMFDWNRLKFQDQGYNQHGCADGTVECSVTPTEQQGNMSLVFKNEMNKNLLTMAHNAGKFRFGMIVTGDDNPGKDCKHSGLTLHVGYMYYE